MPGSPSNNVLFASCVNPSKSELTLPGLVVVANGLMIDEKPDTYEAAREYLFEDDCLVAMINRGRTPVGVLVMNADDFDKVSLEGFEAMFMVEPFLADEAR